MSKMIGEKQVAERLLQAQSIALLCHKNPDGDTIGCGFGLYYALKQLGKQVVVCCDTPFPEKYGYMMCEMEPVEADYIVSVDVADEKLLGENLMRYAGRVDLCLDHHPSNTGFAKETCLRADYGAACELIYDVIRYMPVQIDQTIANCLYTGLATDTGCFRFSNTGVHTLRMAADLLELGAQTAQINNDLFETKSRSRLKIEQLAMETLEYHCDNRCAVIAVTLDMMEQSGATNQELEGIAGLPRQIEGVDVGITIRQQGTDQEQRYKVSLRSTEMANVSEIAKVFDGGGHARAAGCEFLGLSLSQVKEALVQAVIDALEGHSR